MFGWLALFAYCAVPTSAGAPVTGFVINGSLDRAPVPGATVVLRIDDHGSLVAVAETTADDQGRFCFDTVPTGGRESVCLPGANYKGIHYPGTRVRLNNREPIAEQTIAVYEPLAGPSPLVAARHEIELRAETEVLVVTETIVVANRAGRSYVGPEIQTTDDSVTLRLSIPPEVEKVTFDKEFFGRQFRVNQGRLETSIPWTPGTKELKFTYRLPFNGRKWPFQRSLDLPCESVRVSVVRKQIPAIACNLPEVSERNGDEVVFEVKGTLLPAGHLIEVELANMPMPWGTLARWVALGMLVMLVLTAACLAFRRRRAAQPAVPEQRHVGSRAA